MAATALLVAGCGAYGGASSATPQASAPAASGAVGSAYVVKVANDKTLGSILVGEDGKTLYVFKKDAGGKSVCNGDCATAWPPFVLEDGETVSGGDGVTGTLATISRNDGAKQVTYMGAPLYYFAKDTSAGDVKGQGFNGVWFVATPSGSASGSGSSAGASQPPSAGDGYSRGGTGASSAPSPAAGAGSVTIADFSFTPGTLTVPVGTTVTWTNTGGAPHTVTADDGSFASATLAAGDTFSQTFDTAGTYAYHCSIHTQMVGTVVVTP
jgi:predicted lipoprotein with Yx(FWY)xxD motif/plastocyanin